MRRLGPRPLRNALEQVTRDAAPAGLLPRVQAAWPEAVGATIAAESEPTAEREGIVTVTCRSAVWAHELELLSADLPRRLNAKIDRRGEDHGVAALRFVVAPRERLR